MTNSTTTDQLPDMEALNKAVQDAEAKVASLNASLANDMPTLMAEAMKSGDFSIPTARGAEVEQAKKDVERAKAKVEEATRNSRWENLAEARKPIEDMLRSLIVDAKPTVNVTDVKGTATVADDGTVKVTLRAVTATPDLSELEAELAKAFDGPAFAATNVKSVEINVLNIHQPNNTVGLRPTSQTNPQFRNAPRAADGDRAGALTWAYNGGNLSSREFLTAVRNSAGSAETAVVTKYSKRFATALDTSGGNGMSNLAKDVAAALNVEGSAK